MMQNELPYATGQQPRLNRYGQLIKEVLQTLLMVAVIYTLLNLAVPRYLVEGSSMEPNFHESQRIFVSRVHYMLDAPKRGDVVVFLNPRHEDGDDLIKRIIGLPGETVRIESGQIYIDGVPIEEPYIKDMPTYSDEIELGEDEYFVLGDNRRNSNDSHDFGPITRDMIVGRAMFSFWPPQWLGFVPDQTYVVDRR